MPKLKSRDHFLPNGFQFLIPETGMKQPISGSFSHVVYETIKVRKANPFLTEKFGWRTDIAGVEAEVEAYNVARAQAHGWTDWLIPDDFGYVDPPPYPPEDSKKKWGVAAGVGRIAAGIAVLLDWLGESGKGVEADLAEKRSAVCASCPKNGGGDWKAYFTAPVAEKIRVQLEMKGDLKLRTSNDEKLKICTACDCPLALKVHVPIHHILAHTSSDTKSRLDPRCWILSEAK